MTMEIRTVTVLGTGILGAQIAFHSAFHSFDVTAYDISQDALDEARNRFAVLAAAYRADGVPGAEDGSGERAAAAITLTNDFASAASSADLVIEAVPEVLAIKQETYRRLDQAAPAAAIFATNSSSLLPSDMKEATGRPERFLALHFANYIWRRNTAEIMGTADTDPQVFRIVADFAAAIGMVPIEIHKEKAGYVLNSMLVPLLHAGLELVSGGYATPETIDKAWCIGTGSPRGPLQMLDIIGLNTPYNVLVHGDEGHRQMAAWLKENYLDQGKHGITTGEGFYKYRT